MEDWGVDPENLNFKRPKTLGDNFFHAVNDWLDNAAEGRKIIEAAGQRAVSALINEKDKVRVVPTHGYVILPARYLVTASGYEEDSPAEQAEHFSLISLKLVEAPSPQADIILSTPGLPEERPVVTFYSLSAYVNGQIVPLGLDNRNYYTINRAERDVYLPIDPGALPGVDDTNINPAKQIAFRNSVYMGFAGPSSGLRVKEP